MSSSFFDCELCYKCNLIPNFGVKERNYIEKFKIRPDIKFLNYEKAMSCSIEISNILKSHKKYKKMTSDNFVASIIDLAAYASPVSLIMKKIAILDLNFDNLEVFYLINYLLPSFLDVDKIKIVNEIYKKIEEVYKSNELDLKFGSFFNNDYILNKLLIDLLLRTVFTHIKICKFFNIYKNHIILYSTNKKKLEKYVKKILSTLTPYGIGLKETVFYDNRYDDIVISDNLIIVNQNKKTLNAKSINLFKWQLENNIPQVVKLSLKTENLLLKELKLFEVNRIKNGYKQYEGEYLKRQDKWINYLREIF